MRQNAELLRHERWQALRTNVTRAPASTHRTLLPGKQRPGRGCGCAGEQVQSEVRRQTNADNRGDVALRILGREGIDYAAKGRRIGQQHRHVFELEALRKRVARQHKDTDIAMAGTMWQTQPCQQRGPRKPCACRAERILPPRAALDQADRACMVWKYRLREVGHKANGLDDFSADFIADSALCVHLQVWLRHWVASGPPLLPYVSAALLARAPPTTAADLCPAGEYVRHFSRKI